MSYYKLKTIFKVLFIIILLNIILLFISCSSNSNNNTTNTEENNQQEAPINTWKKEIEIQISLREKKTIKYSYIFESKQYSNYRIIFEESGTIYSKNPDNERYYLTNDSWEQVDTNLLLYVQQGKSTICYLMPKENRMFYIQNDYKYEYTIID